MSSLPGVLSRSPPPETWATAVLKSKGGRFSSARNCSGKQPPVYPGIAVCGALGDARARESPDFSAWHNKALRDAGACSPARRRSGWRGGRLGDALPARGVWPGLFSTAEGRHKADLLHSGDLADRLLSLDRMYGSLRVRNRRAAHPRAGGTSQRAAPAGFSRAQGIGTGSCAPGAGCRGLCPFVHAGPGSTSEPVFPSARSVKG